MIFDHDYKAFRIPSALLHRKRIFSLKFEGHGSLFVHLLEGVEDPPIDVLEQAIRNIFEEI